MSGIRERLRLGARSLAGALAIGLLCFTAVSCARSPQVVIISPQLADSPRRIAEQRTVELVVRDDRGSNVIGSRGGVDAQTSTISTEGDITPGLTRLIGEKLEQQGYVVVAPGSGGDIELTIELEELTYNTGGSVLTEVTLSSSVDVTCRRGNETLTSRYTTNHREEFATAPDADDNVELVNMVVGKSLDAMLGDSELADFMSN
ncbi:MAG: hypothetical protein GTO67_05530 [Gammaproteobacteria bacterium]|nr:hypothetical protein [Gammaproteobacteria bacterium]NIM71968.1 hypothetical protein [Gammaproteobacteria bacterium]NIN38155.1 hypothetical protein [Gammaproteobacteria bacterium]NIO25579.1 hypothetical protein [Gammaproteobacteria bacterium]NIO64338.1 hypothetical protein [Gammaproteobacteria bacterium]